MRIRGVAENAAGGLIAATVAALASSVISWLNGLDAQSIALVAVGVFAIVLLAIMLFSVRAASHRETASPPATPPVRQDEQDELRLLGRTDDERAVMLCGAGRLIEFDSRAYQFWAGRNEKIKEDIALAVKASPYSQFGRFDLETIVKGSVPELGRPYVETIDHIEGRRGLRFWSLPEATESSPIEVRAWAFGRSWTDTVQLLKDGCAIVNERLGLPIGKGLETLQSQQMSDDRFRWWVERVNGHLLGL